MAHLLLPFPPPNDVILSEIIKKSTGQNINS
jgi:hypothetical protein